MFGVDGAATVVRLQQEMIESGLAIAPAGSAGFFATPESMVGALGMPTAVVVVPAPGHT